MKPRRKRKSISEDSFKAKVKSWALKVRVKPKQIRVQKMTRKWASCSTKGYLTFSEKLLHETSKFRDFVIVHELLHLKIPNHGKLFKSLLSAHVPGWRRWEKKVSATKVTDEDGT